MSELKTFIGKQSKTYTEEVSKERVDAFNRATGFTGFEEAGSISPTWITRFRMGEFALLDEIGVPLRKVLHGEQTYEYLAPISPDTSIEYRTALDNVMEKSGRTTKMTFLIFKTEMREKESQTLLASSHTTMIVREKKQ